MNNLTDADLGRDEHNRSVSIFKRAGLKVALPTDAIVSIAEWRRPTPLPHAPPSVLGVVSIQGRMLTVLDPTVLLEKSGAEVGRKAFLIALRGNEQLALVVDEKGETVSCEIDPIQENANEARLGVIQQPGETIDVLDVTKLFALAIRGRERRKRTFQVG